MNWPAAGSRRRSSRLTEAEFRAPPSPAWPTKKTARIYDRLPELPRRAAAAQRRTALTLTCRLLRLLITKAADHEAQHNRRVPPRGQVQLSDLLSRRKTCVVHGSIGSHRCRWAPSAGLGSRLAAAGPAIPSAEEVGGDQLSDYLDAQDAVSTRVGGRCPAHRCGLRQPSGLGPASALRGRQTGAAFARTGTDLVPDFSAVAERLPVGRRVRRVTEVGGGSLSGPRWLAAICRLLRRFRGGGRRVRRTFAVGGHGFDGGSATPSPSDVLAGVRRCS